MAYEVVIFDFDGVLCHDRFYSNLDTDYPDVRDYIETQIFGGTSDIPDRWMRNQLTSDDVNRLISANTGIDFALLSRLLDESVAQMRIDYRLTDLALALRRREVLVALVTGNMDVFNRITLRHHDLHRFFPVIVNSCDYGCLKHEADGRLFDVAMRQLGRKADYRDSLLIDDSSQAREIFRRKGGDAFPYTTYEVFRPWMEKHWA